MEHCLIFCSLPVEGVPTPVAGLIEDAFLIAVDGGLSHFETMGLPPHVWVGDGDSLRRTKRFSKGAFPRVKLPRSKAYTDLEYALYIAGQAFFDGVWDGAVALFGAQGERFDHELGNIFAAQRWLEDMASAVGRDRCPDVYSYGPNGLWIGTMGQVRFDQPKGRLFSVFTFDRNIRLTIRGAKYNVKNRIWDHGTLGISNEGRGKTVSVDLSRKSQGPVFIHIPGKPPKS